MDESPRSGRRYPNQQLKQVAVEVYFHGAFSALLKLDKLQTRLRPEFSQLFVPNVQPELAPALQPYQLKSETGTETVAVAINQIAYWTTSYPGFGVFQPRAEELLSGAIELFEIAQIERVVFRYENEIGVQKAANGTISLDDILVLGSPAWRAKQPILQIESTWNTRLEGGQQHVRLRTEDAALGSVVKLTIAAIVAPAGEASGLSMYLLKAHDHAVECFESMITDEFRAYISAAEDG